MVFKKNPLIRPAPKKFIGKGGHKSAGILDDFAVRKNVATKEGTIEKVPVNDSDIANKKYVDDEIAGVPGGVDWTADQSGVPLIIHANNYVDNDTTYTDADAVSAVSTADDYLLNTGDTATGNYTFDSTTLHIDSTNHKVGIGDTTPSEKLDVAGNVRADDYIEYSQPLPEGDALSAVMLMKNKEDGTLDHSSFPTYKITEKEIDGEIIKKESISLSAQVKYLIKAVQELKAEIDILKQPKSI